MSARNGDKARFHRQRIAKLKQRERMRELQKALDEKAPKATTKRS